MQNATDPEGASVPDVVTRIAAATAARRRRPDYAAEVRSLLDAARTVIAETGRARVADIVSEAGLSNDAFYRHFSSKDALVAALVDEGTERIAASTRRRMEAALAPAEQVGVWLDTMVAQCRAPLAGATLAVLNASTNFTTGMANGDHRARAPIAGLLLEPFAALGSADPELDAELVTHAVLSRVAGHLWAGTTPTSDECDRMLEFCLAAPRAGE